LLTPLLRLADGLDRGHEQRVDEIQWAAERLAQAFLEVYGLPLNVARARL
jgi:hypothetical protein